MIDNIAMSIMNAKHARERNHHAMRAARSRLMQDKITMDTRTCPGCGHALKIRTVPQLNQTHFICPSCGAFKTFDIAMDEGRLIGEEFIPGVTGRVRGKVVVRMRADGSIERVIGG